jgi:hypothetical protein
MQAHECRSGSRLAGTLLRSADQTSADFSHRAVRNIPVQMGRLLAFDKSIFRTCTIATGGEHLPGNDPPDGGLRRSAFLQAPGSTGRRNGCHDNTRCDRKGFARHTQRGQGGRSSLRKMHQNASGRARPPGSRGMLHCGTTASPTIRSPLKPSRRARRANFWLSLANETQKGESEQPFEALSWHVVVYGVSAWSRVRIGRAF